MSLKYLGPGLVALALSTLFTINAQAASLVFNFTGECDDCAFSGSPADAGFDPLGDGLTETVTGTLVLPNVGVAADGSIVWGGATPSPPVR